MKQYLVIYDTKSGGCELANAGVFLLKGGKVTKSRAQITVRQLRKAG